MIFSGLIKFVKDNWKTFLPLILSADRKGLNKQNAKLILRDASGAVLEGAICATQIPITAFWSGIVIGLAAGILSATGLLILIYLLFLR